MEDRSFIQNGEVTKDLELLLLGKTGNGKSATGNSLLLCKAFKAGASASSLTSEVTFEYAQYKDRAMKVVDAPGVGDTRGTSEEALHMVAEKLADAITANPQGYHAFLLVLRYGVRFTEEDVNAITMLKRIFGASFVKKFCVLILTCGDIFEQDYQDTGTSFQDWCNEQTGCFATIRDECDNRVLLFNNYERDPRKKERQLDELIAVVDKILLRGRRYTDHYFEKARQSRERFLVESKVPIIEEKTLKETRLIIQEMNAICALQPEEQISRLNNLLPRVVQLAEEISTQDKGTGALDKMKETVDSLRTTVNTEIKICERVLKEREQMAREREELRQERELDAMKLQAMEERERRAHEAHADEMRLTQEKLKVAEARYQAERQRLEAQARNSSRGSGCSIL
ncbi:unnamed protein product [Lymnaea stagnalis]|uniref:AIG1-type G domain-containing protein n=1 Tax=Lymnaea stagnalis TaxID=6523 RepID=A0AAV2ILZ3_LYMST